MGISLISFVNFINGKYILIINVHICPFTCTIPCVHGRAPKRVFVCMKSRVRKIIIYEDLHAAIFGHAIRISAKKNFHCALW